ncbi:MAG TPA: helix-turn-helix transcriptional regulator [Solirubrobacterales bacterium]
MKSNPGSKSERRLSATSFAVLALLDQFGDLTSYDIKQAIEHSVANFWNVPHTTAYEEPARLAAAGYLSVREEPAGRRRKAYSLTAAGRAALREWAAEPPAPPQLRDELVLKLFAGGDPEALAPERLLWHESKLAELEGYLAELAESEDERLQASRNTVLTGIAYHRAMIELMERLRAGRAQSC